MAGIDTERLIAEKLVQQLKSLPTNGPGWDQKARSEAIAALQTVYGDVSEMQTLWFVEFVIALLNLRVPLHRQ
jgi:hypothetical protein